MQEINLFCFGFGQVAKYFVKNLIQNNFDIELAATNTNNSREEKINNLRFNNYYFLDDKFDDKLLIDLKSADKVLISIPPKKKIDIVLRNFYKIFQKNKFNWVTYLSATSVYGDKKGKWVNEESVAEPTTSKGIARLNAENEWLGLYKDFKLPLQIFRLSGIYSTENNIIARLRKGTVKIVEKKNHFFSRIHVDDIAEILKLSLNNFNSGHVFNLSDDYPCSNEEIAQYAAKLINIKMPEKIKQIDIDNNMIKDFYKDSKKVSNKKMKVFFKYNLKYPTYKDGLKIIKNHFI